MRTRIYICSLIEARLQAERDSAVAAVVVASQNPGWRPKVSMKLSKRELELRLLKMKNEIAFEYSNALHDAKALSCSVRKGFISQLICEKKIANGIAVVINIPGSRIFSLAKRLNRVLCTWSKDPNETCRAKSS